MGPVGLRDVGLVSCGRVAAVVLGRRGVDGAADLRDRGCLHLGEHVAGQRRLGAWAGLPAGAVALDAVVVVVVVSGFDAGAEGDGRTGEGAGRERSAARCGHPGFPSHEVLPGRG